MCGSRVCQWEFTKKYIADLFTKQKKDVILEYHMMFIDMKSILLYILIQPTLIRYLDSHRMCLIGDLDHNNPSLQNRLIITISKLFHTSSTRLETVTFCDTACECGN